MQRNDINKFQQIPNVGKATEKDFMKLGIFHPLELVDKDPYKMYQDLCLISNQKHDPCVIDVFISAVRYMQGEPARKWWEYSQERKNRLES